MDSDGLIISLLISLETKLINREKLHKLEDYLLIQNNEIADNIISVLEDYNNVINQASISIRSLHCENQNLTEIIGKNKNRDSNITKTSQGDNNLYERYLNTEEYEKSNEGNLFKLNYNYELEKEESRNKPYTPKKPNIREIVNKPERARTNFDEEKKNNIHISNVDLEVEIKKPCILLLLQLVLRA